MESFSKVKTREMRRIYLPRERAKMKGIGVLSDYELLALIFRTGTTKKDVLEISKDVLKHVKTLSNLATVTRSKLCEVEGIGDSKALGLLASIELGKRIYQNQSESVLLQISSPSDCVSYFNTELKFNHQEVFIVIFLNAKNNVLSYEEIYKGGLTTIQIHPREVFRAAIEQSAAGIILLHNHPSGDPTPSTADIETTKILIEAGEIIGVPILDHIIIGRDSYESLKSYGVI